MTPAARFVLVHVTAVALCVAYACDDGRTVELPSVKLVPPAPAYVDGADAWEALGFTLVEEPLVECNRGWYASDPRQVDCTITIGVVVDPGLIERLGSDAAANRAFRTVYIDDDNHAVVRALAHEAGHILLDTPRHTHGGVMGGASTELRDVDYALACEAIGVCR